MGKKNWPRLEKTVGLMLRMCKLIFGTGEVAILTVSYVLQREFQVSRMKGFTVGPFIKSGDAVLRKLPET